MIIPRDQVAAGVGLGDTQSCRVYVQRSSRGNSAERLRHGTPFLSPTHVDSPVT